VHLEALVGAAVAGHNWSVRDQRVVNTRVRNQVGLELVQIDVQGAIESETRGDGADHLGDQAVQVLVARTGNVEVATADVVHGLVVDQEGTVRVLDGAVGGQHGVVRLNHCGRNTRRRVDGELKLRLLSIVGGETLEQQGTETGTGTTTEGMEDQETLERRAVV
jgi:hypothetical protein